MCVCARVCVCMRVVRNIYIYIYIHACMHVIMYACMPSSSRRPELLSSSPPASDFAELRTLLLSPNGTGMYCGGRRPDTVADQRSPRAPVEQSESITMSLCTSRAACPGDSFERVHETSMKGRPGRGRCVRDCGDSTTNFTTRLQCHLGGRCHCPAVCYRQGSAQMRLKNTVPYGSSFFRTWFELTTKDIYRVRTHADIDTHGMACVSTHAHLIDTFYVCLRKQKDVCMSANGALYYNAHTYLFVFLTMCVGDRKPTHRHRHTHTKYKCTE